MLPEPPRRWGYVWRALQRGVLGTALLAASSAAAQDLEPLLKRAHALLLAGKPAAAITLFEQADAASGGRSAEASIGAALAHLRLDHHAEAIERAKQALAMELPAAQAIDAWAVLGSAIYERERHDWLSRLGAYYVAAYASGTRGEAAPPFPSWDEADLAEAEAAFRRMIDLSGGKANQARLSLAEVLRREGRFGDALRVLEDFERDRPSGGPRADTAPLESCLRWSAKGMAPALVDSEAGSRPMKIAGDGPQYTDEARKARIEGTVTLLSIITEEGKVECVDVIQGLPMGLTDEAVRAVRQWRFKPATLHGAHVPVWLRTTVSLRTQGFRAR